jgi:cytochrome c
MKHALTAAVLLGLSLGAAAEAPKGDAERGRLVFGQCRTCHYPEKTYGDHNGPNLYGIFGRKAGSVASYAYYSDQMKNAGFAWTPELLDFWLANMGKFLPESTMVVFETTPQQRADIIEYLKQFKDQDSPPAVQ